MTAHIPEWAPFDAASPPELPGVDPGSGRVVALVASPTAAAGGWTGEVTATLVRAWSASGLRVVVADADLERPSLHDAFGVPNEEGLTDALLWGASVQRVARPLTADGFYVITAGTPVSDGAVAFEGARWGQLCAGFREAGVTLVALVPDGGAGWRSVLAAATDVFLLSGPGDDVGGAATEAAAKLRGVLGFDVETEAAALEGGRADEGVDASWRDPLEAPPGEPTPALDAAPSPLEPAPDPLFDEVAPTLADADPEPADPLEDVGDPLLAGSSDALDPAERPGEASAPARAPMPFERGKAAAKGSGGRTWLLWALVVVVVIVAAILLGLGGFSLGSDEGDADTAAAELQAAPATGVLAAASPPVEESPVLGFSLAVGSYQDGAVARRRAVNLANRVPGVIVAAVPLELDGAVYHRVLAGPARDSADASRLAGVVARASGLDPSSWVLRPTPRAFRLGEMDDLDAARRRVDVLLELDVPAYVLAVDYSDGSTRYRVYAGAFADEVEADHLSGLLRERGLTTATLSDRIGRLPE